MDGEIVETRSLELTDNEVVALLMCIDQSLADRVEDTRTAVDKLMVLRKMALTSK